MPAYRHSEKIWRFADHNRECDFDAPTPYTETAYGYLRMGEEAAPLYLSESGMAEVENLRGQREKLRTWFARVDAETEIA